MGPDVDVWQVQVNVEDIANVKGVTVKLIKQSTSTVKLQQSTQGLGVILILAIQQPTAMDQVDAQIGHLHRQLGDYFVVQHRF